jgi:exodeoxyribonuclease V beta subunit
MQPFDLEGPLPAEGSTTVLEASAGTGKTYALATLVTRYLAEGVTTLDQMLLITFNRAASRELRERVRAQIAKAVAVVDDEQGARRTRKLRRRYHRDHPRVLRHGAQIAWGGR